MNRSLLYKNILIGLIVAITVAIHHFCYINYFNNRLYMITDVLGFLFCWYFICCVVSGGFSVPQYLYKNILAAFILVTTISIHHFCYLSY
jgi:predicted membrane protein